MATLRHVAPAIALLTVSLAACSASEAVTTPTDAGTTGEEASVTSAPDGSVDSGASGETTFRSKSSAGLSVHYPANSQDNTNPYPVTGGFVLFAAQEGSVQFCPAYEYKAKNRQLLLDFASKGDAIAAGTFARAKPGDLGDGLFEARIVLLDGTCSEVSEEEATDGTLTLSQVSASEVSGVLDARFPSGTVHEPFRVAICAKTYEEVTALGAPTCVP